MNGSCGCRSGCRCIRELAQLHHKIPPRSSAVAPLVQYSWMFFRSRSPSDWNPSRFRLFLHFRCTFSVASRSLPPSHLPTWELRMSRKCQRIGRRDTARGVALAEVQVDPSQQVQTLSTGFFQRKLGLRPESNSLAPIPRHFPICR